MYYVSIVVVITLLLLSSMIRFVRPRVTSIYGRGKIIGGRKAEAGEFPYMVGFYTEMSLGFLCNGAVLSESKVITSSQCFYLKRRGEPEILMPPENYTVVAGAVNIYDTTYQESKIKKYVFQKGREHLDDYLPKNSIALAILSTEFTLKYDLVEAIRIPSIVPLDYKFLWEDLVLAREICQHTGYGATTQDPVGSPYLKVMEVIPQEHALGMEYQKYENQTVTEGMVSTRSASLGEGACAFDYGSQFYCKGFVWGTLVSSFGICKIGVSYFQLYLDAITEFGLEANGAKIMASTNIFLLIGILLPNFTLII